MRKATGHDLVLAPEVTEVGTKIAQKCAHLPLAIVTVAGSTKGLNSTHEWKNALNEFSSLVKEVSDDRGILLTELVELWIAEGLVPEMNSVEAKTAVYQAQLSHAKETASLPPVDNKQATAPPSLKLIWGDEEWWESLERNDPGTKIILQPFWNGDISDESDRELLFGDVGWGRFLILEDLGFAMLFDSPPINFRLIVA
ncbi:hypothetical protein Vadar_008215 [Vaccinium darrowii]|uniref:Uncharacterized protein n=1 Tax=Vaccinium darrowii TaxID=229202 RepID=A0ACB7WYX8_9ERIC|nr:hypothetical protein Vadar_008215 [Vaccinium darrowii]